jgi:hypothetical protein
LRVSEVVNREEEKREKKFERERRGKA